MTVAGRLPRLANRRDIRWTILAIVAFVCGALPCLLFLSPDVSRFLDEPLLKLFGFHGDRAGNALFVLVAALVSLTRWIAPRAPRMGRRYLAGSGTLLLAVAIVCRLYAEDATTAIWPLVLGALMFLYLWLLGVMMFDLAFIWHRYIRNSIALYAMRAWRKDQPSPPVKAPAAAVETERT